MLAQNVGHDVQFSASGNLAAGWDSTGSGNTAGLLVLNPAPAASPSSAPYPGFHSIKIDRK